MNEISNQLQSELTTIRINIESEKKEFLEKCRKAQSKLQFDLLDNNIINKISEVIKMINEANTSYYAYLKAKLDDVDKRASGYTLDDLDYEVVKQVYELICFINEESKIENSFEGTLNHGFSSLDLGTMAIVTYNPSLAAKEIELKWREKLRDIPASKKQVYLDKKDLEQAERANYKKELDAWKVACAPIKTQRENYIHSVIKQKEDEIKGKIDIQYSQDKSAVESSIDALQEELKIKETELKHLGFFKMKEKSELKAKIADLSNKIEDLSASLSRIKCQYDESLLTVFQQARQLVESAAVIEAEKKYPYPTEPDKPEVIKKEEQQFYSFIIDLHTMFLEEDRPLSVNEINNYFMGQKSNMDIRKALSQGIKDNLFEEHKIGNQSYYYLKL